MMYCIPTNKIARALGAAALFGVCLAAHAQSNVTIYGRIDAGVNYQSGVQIGSTTKTGT
ncbi:putative porin, partial [Herbaspirillum sp. Sphag1AN]|uniref:porin n=1 Tax=unclassified Herbaspirillum TaxID=2624150 RepID=UPI00183C9120|nr:putative porin [Herbaspirillum sp. Sphag1AN]MBB3248040.1 putative porin [Herbaspirillum sp. Sphag64]